MNLLSTRSPYGTEIIGSVKAEYCIIIIFTFLIKPHANFCRPRNITLLSDYCKLTQHFILYTIKIVYFVRATCFDLIGSSSGPPRRQIQDLCMFRCIVGSEMLTIVCSRIVKYMSLYTLNLRDCRHASSTYTSETNPYIIYVSKLKMYLFSLLHYTWGRILKKRRLKQEDS